MILRLPLAALLLALGVDTTHALPSELGLNSALEQRWDKSAYVRAEGTKLMNKEQEFFVSGFNYYACMNLAADDDAGGNHSRFETEMQQMADLGVNTVRIMASSEGAPTIQPYRMYPALMSSPYEWNEDLFVGLDRCLAKMESLGQKAIMTLADTWPWSGGFGQYVSWTFADNGSIPYPPCWDPTLNSPYGDYATNGSWDTYTYYTLQFYEIPEAQSLYRAHIDKVLNRKNTVTGVQYSEDPTILAWELANEPQVPLPYAWVDDTAAYIHNHSKQMVTTGFEGKQGEDWWKLVHKSPHIDFGSCHWWVENQGIVNATNSSEANVRVAQESIVEYLHNVSRWTQDLGKPTILEEFGCPRDEWVAVEQGAPTEFYLYAASNPTTLRDAYFQTVVDTVVDLFQNNSGIVGFMPWTWGGVWRPTDARNEYNEIWAGDPPHEAPGWYDVYDTDNSTLSILRKAYAQGAGS